MKSTRRMLTLAAAALLALSIGCTANTGEVEKLRKELDALKAATPVATSPPTPTPSPTPTSTATPALTAIATQPPVATSAPVPTTVTAPAPISVAIVTKAVNITDGSVCGVPPSQYAAAKAAYDAADAAVQAAVANPGGTSDAAFQALLDARTRVSAVVRTFNVEFTLLGQTNGYCGRPTAPCALEARVGFALPASCR